MIEITLQLPTDQYRALAAIATRRRVRAHVLVEDLVARALAKPSTAEPDEPDAVEAPPEHVGTRSEVERILADIVPLPASETRRPSPELDQAREDRIRFLFDAGATDQEIADSAGMTLSSMRKRRSRMGLLRDPALAETIREYHSRGTV